MKVSAMIGGEMLCHVCGRHHGEPIWGADGQAATFDICACCGCEFGYEDSSAEGIRCHRETWLATNSWFDPSKRPARWNREDQLSKVPQFYFRVLPGLPGTGEPPAQFNVTENSMHSEGLVVEFTRASGRRWVGNFQGGDCGARGVLAVPGRTDQALVLAEGQAYVVAPQTCGIVRAFGGQISDVVSLLDRDGIICGNGLWFECIGPAGLDWRTRRISWDGMREVSLDGSRLHGSAFSPVEDAWLPFEVDLDTGDVIGGSYPPELPQP